MTLYGFTLLKRLGEWLPVLALAAACVFAGSQLGRAPLLAENADLRAAAAETARLAALASAQRLQEAQALSESLSSQLAETLATNDQLLKEKTHALQSATSGRACLSERALRVLNGAPGIAVDGLPPAQPGAAATHAAAAPAANPNGAGTSQPAHVAPELEATDTSIALWIAAAGTQYEACRQRLSALIAWHQKPTTREPLREPNQ